MREVQELVLDQAKWAKVERRKREREDILFQEDLARLRRELAAPPMNIDEMAGILLSNEEWGRLGE